MSKINVPSFGGARVLVVGDVMLDRYWSGDVARISPEAPVPVVEIGQHEDRAGGAANVAINLAALGIDTALVGLVGNDPTGAELRALLGRAGIACNFVESETEPTILKLRVLSRNQQLIRLDMEKAFRRNHAASIAAATRQSIDGADVLVISDYGKNTLSDIGSLIALADGRPVLVDPKGTDFTRYRGVTLLKPNQAEFEAVAGKCASEADLIGRGREMVSDLALQHLLITRGAQGMLLVSADGSVERFSARAQEVYDVTGAGDTVISLLAAALAAGEAIVPATALANLAAGIVVGKLGTASVTPVELSRAASEIRGIRFGVSIEANLLEELAEARGSGERIVFTNGCFDILHAGHVHYLEQARALGDRLVVGVNSDKSVRRLKGAGRPVNPLDGRMRVLAGLRAVDWVVPFAEDTPERLLQAIRPDILAKGGDYTIDKIAGAGFVQSYGGEVHVLDHVAGLSTTAILTAARGQE